MKTFFISWFVLGFIATLIRRIWCGRKCTIGEYIVYTCIGYLGFWYVFIDVIFPPLGELIAKILSWEI